MMKRNKTYLGIFYGSNKHLNEAFLNITDGGFIRYIVTDETLICRFKSKLDIQEIEKIFNQHVKNIPFFIFPINNKKWTHNLPHEAENNLLTDNPIIKPKVEQPVDLPANFFLNLLDELKSRKEETEKVERNFKNWINEKTDLSKLVNNDGFIEINGYSVEKEELINLLEKQMGDAVEEEDYRFAANIKKKLEDLDDLEIKK